MVGQRVLKRYEEDWSPEDKALLRLRSMKRYPAIRLSDSREDYCDMLQLFFLDRVYWAPLSGMFNDLKYFRRSIK